MTDIKTPAGAAASDATGPPGDPTATTPAALAAAAPAGPAGGGPPGAAVAVPIAGRRNEVFYFARRNAKVVGGACVLGFFLLLALVGPLLTEHSPTQFNVGPIGQSPSAEHWVGTTWRGEDIFTQLAYGTRSTLLVGAMAAVIAAVIGMTTGFVAGYLGGKVDEILMMFTNVVLVLPAFVVLIVVTSYMGINNVATQALVIGLFTWPWVARAVRAQTFTLRSRDFVDLARLTGVDTLTIIRKEVAPNMASYLVMVFILLFAGAILFAAALDFLSLGPRGGMSLGLMLSQANDRGAMSLGTWWWFIPPGAGITMITGALYVTNVGLDEVFNPKLREM